MRFLFLSALILTPAFAVAKLPPQEVVTKISFQLGSRYHRYTLQKEGAKPVYKLIFQQNGKPTKAKVVSSSQADWIRNEATQILWTSQYRKPASVQTCTEYAKIIAEGEKSQICVENKKATGRSYGLLNSLRRIFN